VRPAIVVAVVVAVFGLAVWATVPAIGQDKPAESGALDPRLKSLVGTWEGQVQLRESRSEQGRVLVIQERSGQLEGRFGVSGKGLERVVLATEVDGGRPKISFKVSSGNTYSLELVKDGWLSGKMTLTGGNRGGSSPDRPVELERKK
jgi:hypothetical protein